MNMTLYLTERCNLACRYCYQGEKPDCAISFETAKAAVDYSVSRGDKSTGICFFGGEPLLCKDTLYGLIDYCNGIAKTGHCFSFKLVTNGLLLDDEFLRFATDNGIVIALSHDGKMQDDCRVFPDGSGTFDILEEKIDLLLKYQPYAISMTTIEPSCAEKFAASMEYLFDKGFRNIVTTPRYDRECRWDDESLEILRRELDKISDLYIRWTLDGKNFSYNVFESKIQSYIQGEGYKHKTCNLGERQVVILPSGKIYPCQQFVGEDKYLMGDIFGGIIPERLDYIRSIRDDTPDICSGCALKKRCRYNCCCLNKQCTGSIGSISPFQCNYEQMIIHAADRSAEELYRRGNTDFLKKQYNKYFDLLEGV